MLIWDGGRKIDQYAAPDAGDWRNIVSEVQTVQKVVNNNSNTYNNDVGEDIVSGQPLILESGLLKLASKDNPEVIGISLGETSYVTQGQLTLEDWSIVTNFLNLVPGRYYYLSNQKGKLTNIPPNQVGEILVIVGRAQTLNTLDIDIELPIYL